MVLEGIFVGEFWVSGHLIVVFEGARSSQSSTIPSLGWRHYISRRGAAECKMATALLAQATALKTQELSWGPSKEMSRAAIFHAQSSWIGAQEGYHLVALVVHYRKIPSIDPPQETVGIDRPTPQDHCGSDWPSVHPTEESVVWTWHTNLKVIKARGKCWGLGSTAESTTTIYIYRHDISEPESPYIGEETETQESSQHTIYAWSSLTETLGSHGRRRRTIRG